MVLMGVLADYDGINFAIKNPLIVKPRHSDLSGSFDFFRLHDIDYLCANNSSVYFSEKDIVCLIENINPELLKAYSELGNV